MKTNVSSALCLLGNMNPHDKVRPCLLACLLEEGYLQPVFQNSFQTHQSDPPTSVGPVLLQARYPPGCPREYAPNSDFCMLVVMAFLCLSGASSLGEWWRKHMGFILS